MFVFKKVRYAGLPVVEKSSEEDSSSDHESRTGLLSQMQKTPSHLKENIWALILAWICAAVVFLISGLMLLKALNLRSSLDTKCYEITNFYSK
jgi:hypothetical protein